MNEELITDGLRLTHTGLNYSKISKTFPKNLLPKITSKKTDTGLIMFCVNTYKFNENILLTLIKKFRESTKHSKSSLHRARISKEFDLRTDSQPRKLE